MLPLVSIMMPCYNAAKTLPWSLASLVAQTYPHWECVLADDGSTDRPGAVVCMLGDPRVKVVRLERNSGRGAARQAALEHVSGDLLCMLDADDWLYPEKIHRQVVALRERPELALVSAGMAIVDGGGRLAGVRCRGAAGPLRALGPVNRLGPPPVAFGPSMMRTDLARRLRFDALFPSCEDIDYLIRYLSGRRYAVLSDVLYTYNEHASATPAKMIENIARCRAVYAKHRALDPLGNLRLMGMITMKEAVYRAAFGLGLGHRLIGGRSAAPDAADEAAHRAALRTVGALVQRIFPESDADAESAPAAQRWVAATGGCL